MSMEKTKMNSKKRDKFVRYSEGATMYHMAQSKFMQLAKDAKACYKVGQMEHSEEVCNGKECHSG